MKRMMIAFVLASAACAVAIAPSSGQSPSCKSQAAAKKLSGAAHDSFVKKCENDAQATCDAQAVKKNLHGAAKTSFTNKCVTDARGS